MKAHATPQQRLRSRNRLRREFKEPIRNAGHAWLFTLPTVTDTAHTLGRERRKERHKSEMSGKNRRWIWCPQLHNEVSCEAHASFPGCNFDWCWARKRATPSLCEPVLVSFSSPFLSPFIGIHKRFKSFFAAKSHRVQTSSAISTHLQLCGPNMLLPSHFSRQKDAIKRKKNRNELNDILRRRGKNFAKKRKEVLVMSMRHTKKGEGSKRSQKKTKKGVKKEYKEKTKKG